jgi:hypothetical protein
MWKVNPMIRNLSNSMETLEFCQKLLWNEIQHTRYAPEQRRSCLTETISSKRIFENPTRFLKLKKNGMAMQTREPSGEMVWYDHLRN